MMSAYIVELALSTIKTWLFGGALLAFVIGGVAYQQHREAKAEAHRQWLVQRFLAPAPWAACWP